ncbi:MAG: aminotransferase class V-fold PLP-dependent enzyme [Verrucomicrobia bacterium]|nr:aminotransferase class V-fold PLP-dependent enzyme [Verrucomicrobiota bacterium]MBS0637455.1 aminotransferase class V-fold PLP-dependent enzyme [Verrucomicrobiota bacterium]
MTEEIYLNYASASACSKNALMAAIPLYEQHEASYVSIEPIKTLFGISQGDQFVFTSSGAAACSMAIFSAYHSQTKFAGKNHFIARDIDEAPSILAISSLEEDGCFLKLAPTAKRGFLTLDDFIETVSPRTALLSLSWASGHTGVIQPLDEIAAVCKERGIWLHVDATHVVGKLDIRFSELPIDILTFSGHGLQAPVGTGGLIAKPHIPLKPAVFGAPENSPMLAALAESCRLALEDQSLYCTEVARLRDLFEQSLAEASVLYKDEERVPHITAFSFPGIHNELLAYVLRRKGIVASLGSFSLSKDTQADELERAAQIINEAVKRMKRLSRAFL